ncbi:MAG: hypothetical protein OHK0021_08520 [Bryobacter sp.]
MIVEYAVERAEATGNALTLDAFIWYRPAFVLSATPWSFIPRDARDAVSECSNPANEMHCFPAYTAQVYTDDFYSYGYIAENIRFKLNDITSLRGTSDNQGNSNELDYFIDPARQTPNVFANVAQSSNQTSIETNSITAFGNLVITSRDFGGTARLEAEIDFPEDPDFGGPLTAEVTLDGIGDPEDPRVPAYASNLPFDSDGNGIADVWEEQHLNAGGRFTNIAEDEEPGYDPDSPKGDGLSAHDEYRGLHHIERDGSNPQVRHRRFDPTTTQDVFYVDRDNAFVGSVGVILANQKKSGAPQTIHKYWEVNRDQGQIEKGKRQSTSRLAKNSNTGGEKVGTFAILLTPDIPPADQAVDKNTKVLGYAQTGQMDGKAILIDRQAIISLSPSRQIDPDTFIAKVVAHEFGHKLSLEHPVRPNCCIYQPAITSTSQLSNLTMGEFALLNQPSNTIYVRLRSYIDPIDGNKEYSDERLQLLSNGPVLPLKKEKRVSFPDGTHVYRITLNRRINSTFNAPNGTVATWSEVLEIQQKLMDWTAVRILRQPADWKFAEGPRNHKRSNIEQLKAKE